MQMEMYSMNRKVTLDMTQKLDRNIIAIRIQLGFVENIQVTKSLLGKEQEMRNMLLLEINQM